MDHIPRIKIENSKEFYQQFILQNKPVIITNFQENWAHSSNFTRSALDRMVRARTKFFFFQLFYLLGPGTDMVQVKALKDGIIAGVETSLCLLNYRADGSPFFNQVPHTRHIIIYFIFFLIFFSKYQYQLLLLLLLFILP